MTKYRVLFKLLKIKILKMHINTLSIEYTIKFLTL